MIAGCIDKMRRDACGGCEQRDACAELFPFMAKARGRTAARARGAGISANPFFSFLGEVAKAFEARAAERKAPPRASPFRAEVEHRLEPLLASGEVGIERLARDLGYSRQTLYRRLKAEGVTYEQTLDGLRQRLALRFLGEGLSVKEAAYRLGFSDPAAFSRAFKRWTGSSPSDMRTRH
ncbi:MAG TPA: AraC family transcriptional regulator [Allosphingosinicella sp.]|nr:AraC family transcriptional regulator [Allosphingosinicella sp.]